MSASAKAMRRLNAQLTASGLWVDRSGHDLIVYEENMRTAAGRAPSTTDRPGRTTAAPTRAHVVAVA
ncbi:hypothetical protein ME763_35445 [Streptomyces murinus]|uniref:hypothetical protein n=1 Tax=Streptomyces murinus TaxID=33900 RepID=UPI00117E56C0|nr:hypothetical protein [Streptomyces murinus]WDO10521.1 hypothetical protein ME763_35445 [Streptomyces murinus]